MYLGSTPLAQEPRTWSGVLSENKCGASHQAMAASLGMSERECAFHCLKGLAKYVVVDEQKNVIPIANQDFAGIPLRLARPVRVTGVLTDTGIVVSRIEPPLVHAHIGHVMTAWRETPGTVGLLTIALSDVAYCRGACAAPGEIEQPRRHEAARGARAARARSGASKRQVPHRDSARKGRQPAPCSTSGSRRPSTMRRPR